MKAIIFYGIVEQVKNEIKPHLVMDGMVRIKDTLIVLEKLDLLKEPLVKECTCSPYRLYVPSFNCPVHGGKNQQEEKS